VAQKRKPQILKIYISQGIDAVNVCWYIYFFSSECAGERISIGQYLARIWTTVSGLLLWGHPGIMLNCS